MDLPKADSSLVMKSSSPNGLPVRSCRRSASDSVPEHSVERKVTQFGAISNSGATFTNSSSRPVKCCCAAPGICSWGLDQPRPYQLELHVSVRGKAILFVQGI